MCVCACVRACVSVRVCDTKLIDTNQQSFSFIFASVRNPSECKLSFKPAKNGVPHLVKISWMYHQPKQGYHVLNCVFITFARLGLWICCGASLWTGTRAAAQDATRVKRPRQRPICDLQTSLLMSARGLRSPGFSLRCSCPRWGGSGVGVPGWGRTLGGGRAVQKNCV